MSLCGCVYRNAGAPRKLEVSSSFSWSYRWLGAAGCGCWEPNLSLLEGASALKATESSLQPPFLLFVFKAGNNMFLLHIQFEWLVAAKPIDTSITSKTYVFLSVVRKPKISPSIL